MMFLRLAAFLLAFFQAYAMGLGSAYDNSFYGGLYSGINEDLPQEQLVIGGQREARMDPAWRHIGLGKRLYEDSGRWNLKANKGQRTYAMIGLGRR
uniref:Uncharacterized protein n=1 Tax=Ditylenchus dipsaci TaxID=166011 RepID=A0A915CXA1_9BILA